MIIFILVGWVVVLPAVVVAGLYLTGGGSQRIDTLSGESMAPDNVALVDRELFKLATIDSPADDAERSSISAGG